jgi:3D (Asp-Asp-Asp) domain-containing protein
MVKFSNFVICLVAVLGAYIFGLATGVSIPKPVEVVEVTCPKLEIEPKIETQTPKYLGPYKRGRAGVMHAVLSFYDLGPGSINVDEYLEAGKTSIGRKPVVGRTIAVDPKVIPYGSKVFIPGFGWRIAEDTGSKIKGNRIDILVENEEKAFKLGKQSELVLWTR